MSQAEIIDATDEEYFAMDALDQSQLKAFLKNPKEWLDHLDILSDKDCRATIRRRTR